MYKTYTPGCRRVSFLELINITAGFIFFIFSPLETRQPQSCKQMAAAEAVCCGVAIPPAVQRGAVCGAGLVLEGAVGKWPRSGESRDGCPLQSRSRLTSIQTPRQLIKWEQWHGAAGEGAPGLYTAYICIHTCVFYCDDTSGVSGRRTWCTTCE